VWKSRGKTPAGPVLPLPAQVAAAACDPPRQERALKGARNLYPDKSRRRHKVPLIASDALAHSLELQYSGLQPFIWSGYAES
jgi:hypothetical protein